MLYSGKSATPLYICTYRWIRGGGRLGKSRGRAGGRGKPLSQLHTWSPGLYLGREPTTWFPLLAVASTKNTRTQHWKSHKHKLILFSRIFCQSHRGFPLNHFFLQNLCVSMVCASTLVSRGLVGERAGLARVSFVQDSLCDGAGTLPGLPGPTFNL